MATIERDDDEGTDEDAVEREDHAVILARRRMLIATALGGVAVGVEGCDWIEHKLGAAPRVCLDMAPPQSCLQTVAPTPCLNVAEPRPCLEVMAPQAPASDAGTVSAAPCLSTSPEPPSQPLPRPRVCLSRTAPRPVAPPHPRPMVCLSEELVQKRADDEDDG